jgi:haloalkane dehalogenase
MNDPTASRQRPAWVNPALYPFADRWAEVAGCQLHYIDEGEGPVLLLLHGNPTWSFLYRTIILRLRSRFRCIALDYPGFGFSKAPIGYGFTPAEHAAVVEGFVVQLDLHDITIMMQDWGGPIGFGMAERQLERVHALVIGDTWAWPADHRTMVLFSKILGGRLGRSLILRYNLFARVIVPGGVKRHTMSDEVKLHYTSQFPDPQSRSPTAGVPREIVHGHADLEQVERYLPSLRHLPALIVWATKDPAFHEAERTRFEKLFPTHETVVLEGAGHYIQEDAPEDIADAILRWFPATQD